MAFTDPVEPAFEEKEEQLLDSQRPTTPSNDCSTDRPKAILAFPAVPSKNPSPSPSPRPSSQKSIESSERSESPDSVSSEASAVSHPVSPSGLWPTCDIQESQQEDEYDADGMEESIRQEATLRRRASSMDCDTEQTFEAIPAFLTPDSQIKRRKMEIKVIRPNPEIGVLAHMAGVVKINQSGTLQEMREDINRAIPTYLGSLKFLFLSRKFKIIDPRTESQLIVSGIYKKTVYVKVFHGAENCEYFCLCGKVAFTWCPKCNVQGYCGDDCRQRDEREHGKLCSSNKEKALQHARMRRISRADKK